jgi:hypothetical protein
LVSRGQAFLSTWSQYLVTEGFSTWLLEGRHFCVLGFLSAGTFRYLVSRGQALVALGFSRAGTFRHLGSRGQAHFRTWSLEGGHFSGLGLSRAGTCRTWVLEGRHFAALGLSRAFTLHYLVFRGQALSTTLCLVAWNFSVLGYLRAVVFHKCAYSQVTKCTNVPALVPRSACPRATESQKVPALECAQDRGLLALS